MTIALLARKHRNSGVVHATFGHLCPFTPCGIVADGGAPDEDREYEIECRTCARFCYANESEYSVRDYRPLSDAVREETIANMQRARA